MKQRVWEERFRKERHENVELTRALELAKREIAAYRRENEHYRKIIKDQGLPDPADSLDVETEEVKNEQPVAEPAAAQENTAEPGSTPAEGVPPAELPVRPGPGEDGTTTQAN